MCCVYKAKNVRIDKFSINKNKKLGFRKCFQIHENEIFLMATIFLLYMGSLDLEQIS